MPNSIIELVNFGSGNGMDTWQHQAINWTNNENYKLDIRKHISIKLDLKWKWSDFRKCISESCQQYIRHFCSGLSVMTENICETETEEIMILKVMEINKYRGVISMG